MSRGHHDNDWLKEKLNFFPPKKKKKSSNYLTDFTWSLVIQITLAPIVHDKLHYSLPVSISEDHNILGQFHLHWCPNSNKFHELLITNLTNKKCQHVKWKHYLGLDYKTIMTIFLEKLIYRIDHFKLFILNFSLYIN